MKRRGFLTGLLGVAPAIVAAPSLMRISTAALYVPPPVVGAADVYVSDFGVIKLQTRVFTEELLKRTIQNVWEKGGEVSALIINPRLIPADMAVTKVESGRWLSWRPA